VRLKKGLRLLKIKPKQDIYIYKRCVGQLEVKVLSSDDESEQDMRCKK
jgi:hypothetical protein